MKHPRITPSNHQAERRILLPLLAGVYISIFVKVSKSLYYMCHGQNMVWFPIEGDGNPSIDTNLDTHYFWIPIVGWMTTNHIYIYTMFWPRHIWMCFKTVYALRMANSLGKIRGCWLMARQLMRSEDHQMVLMPTDCNIIALGWFGNYDVYDHLRIMKLYSDVFFLFNKCYMMVPNYHLKIMIIWTYTLMLSSCFCCVPQSRRRSKPADRQETGELHAVDVARSNPTVPHCDVTDGLPIGSG